MSLLDNEQFSEVILDDETFYRNMKRLGAKMRAAAKNDTKHLDWVENVKPGETINDSIDRQISEFIDGLEDEEGPETNTPV